MDEVIAVTKEPQIDNKAPHEEQADKLKRLLAAQEPLFIISGSHDSSNIQLPREIASQFKRTHQQLHLQATNALKPSALLQQLHALTNLNAPNVRLRFEEQLQAIINSLTMQQQQILLTIENAHTLNFSVLAAISHLSLLQEHKKPQLLIILTGDPSLYQKIQSLQTRPIPELQLSLIHREPLHCAIEEPPKVTSPRPQPASPLQPLYNKTKINPAFSPNIAPTPSIKLFWIHHQVKSIALSCITLLIGSLWYFNHYRATHIALHAPFSYSSPRSSLVMLSSTKPLLVTKKAPHPYYSVQLISSKNKPTVERFIHSHQLNKLASISSHHQHYVAMMGHFDSYQNAKKSILSMPKAIKKYHPWIKKISA